MLLTKPVVATITTLCYLSQGVNAESHPDKEVRRIVFPNMFGEHKEQPQTTTTLQTSVQPAPTTTFHTSIKPASTTTSHTEKETPTPSSHDEEEEEHDDQEDANNEEATNEKDDDKEAGDEVPAGVKIADGFWPAYTPTKNEEVLFGDSFDITWGYDPKYNGKIELTLIGGDTQNTQNPLGVIAEGVENKNGHYVWDVTEEFIGEHAVYGLSAMFEDGKTQQYSMPFRIITEE